MFVLARRLFDVSLAAPSLQMDMPLIPSQLLSAPLIPSFQNHGKTSPGYYKSPPILDFRLYLALLGAARSGIAPDEAALWIILFWTTLRT